MQEALKNTDWDIATLSVKKELAKAKFEIIRVVAIMALIQTFLVCLCLIYFL